jgi:hypothetical protein
VQVDWDWCHGCGFDPDGRRRQAAPSSPGWPNGGPMGPAAGPWTPPPAAGARSSSSAGRIVAIVLGVCIVGLVLVAGCSVAAVTFLGKAATTTTLADDDPSGASAATPTWTRFAPPGAGFSVELPGTPKEKNEPTSSPGVTLTTHGFELIVDDTDYGVGYIDAPPGSYYNFDQGAAAIAKSLNGTMTDKVAVNYAGNQAMDFTVSSTTDGRGRVRLLVIGNRTYFMVVASSKDPTAIEADFTHLVNSLQLG